MTIREETEQIERMVLSKYASFSDSTMGRDTDDPQCDLRTVYQRDRDRILHCKSFRRLKHKTQVFLSPEGDHYRTRLTHTLEVAQIARTIARALRLNEDLTEAIALGHDLGHTPFGHIGEDTLTDVSGIRFEHCEQSVRVVEKIEKDGKGLNLTKEVRDGILNHRTSGSPGTLEGCIVRYSDKIAYINHDIDDALRSGVISKDDLPAECIRYLGDTHGKRIDTLVTDMIENNSGKDFISQSEECRHYMDKLRNFMFINVYHNEKVKKTEQLMKVEQIIVSLYEYFMDNPDKLPEDYKELIPEFGTDEMVKDYVAGMTDRYSIMMYEKLFEK